MEEDKTKNLAEDRSSAITEILKTPKRVYSTARYTDADADETDFLIKNYLKGRFFFYEIKSDSQSSIIHTDKEEMEEMRQREDILCELKMIIKKWIVQIALKTGMNDELAQQEVAKIFTFGSHRLGVNFRGGDIDTLVLAPNYVKRDEHFFGMLPDILKTEPGVEELIPVNGPTVTVPLIKMKFHGISFDLLFASLDQQKIDERLENLNDDKLLTNMDEKMIRSVNGCRVADMILQCVDANYDQFKISNFRTTLKLIKLWAKNKGLYSNAIGYLGGVSWAILVAKICQMFPNYKPNKLVERFFFYYSKWNWHEYPVLIDVIKADPNEYTKKDEVMKVWTPAYPSMNSTGRVRKITLKIISKQLKDSYNVLKASPKPQKWDKLFEKYDFFKEYANFIEIDVVGKNKMEFIKWKSFVESQIIHYIARLEYCADSYMVSDDLDIHPYTESYEKEDPHFEFCVAYYFGISIPQEWKYHTRILDLRQATIDFMDKLRQKRPEIGESNNVKIYQITRDELPDEVFKNNRPTWAMKKRRRGTSFASEEEVPIRRKLHTNPETESETINMLASQSSIVYKQIEKQIDSQTKINTSSTTVDESIIYNMYTNNNNNNHTNGSQAKIFKGTAAANTMELKNILTNIKSIKTDEAKKKESKPIEEKKKVANIIDENKDLFSNKTAAIEEFLV